MSISGTTVYGSIKSQVSETENEHERLSSKLFDLENQLKTLSSKREQVFTQLSLIYLPEMEAKAVSATLHEVQEDVERIFKEKQDRRIELERDMKNSVEQRKGLEDFLDIATTKLEKKAGERDSLASQVKANLADSDNYRSLVSSSQTQEAQLARNMTRLEELTAERDEKLPAYGKNKLFTYLLNRAFNSENAGKGDSWLARKVVNYVFQNTNYEALLNNPKIAEQEVEKRKKAYETLCEQIRTIEKEQEDKVGFTAVMEEYSEIENEKKRFAAEIEKEDSTYSRFANERTTLDTTKDPYHMEAIAKLKDFLKGEDIVSLKAKARATKTSDDDNLVDEIDSIDEKVRDYKDKAKVLTKERELVLERLEGLKSIRRNYESRGYNSSDSYFPGGFNIQDLLTGYALGRYSRDHVDSTIHSNRRKVAPVYHSSTPSYTSSHRSSSSSSWSSSSHSSGGGFGGGGFSSGRGF